MRQELHRQRENDRRILFGRDAVERLKVAQLKGRRRFVDDVGGLFERPCGLVLAFGSNHLAKERNLLTNEAREC